MFYVDSDGTRLKGDLFSVGSGSTFAYGVLDQGYRWDLSDEEALELGRRSIYAAGHRDAFSGNTINLYHVKENGWEFIGTAPHHSILHEESLIVQHRQLRRVEDALRGAKRYRVRLRAPCGGQELGEPATCCHGSPRSSIVYFLLYVQYTCINIPLATQECPAQFCRVFLCEDGSGALGH